MAEYKVNDIPVFRASVLSGLGSRDGQEDCYGVYPVEGGLFAVVCDGMGGLSHGDQISAMAVRSMIRDAEYISAAAGNKALLYMTMNANANISWLQKKLKDQMSGTTAVAVLAEPERLSWISVGDSRICLFRAGLLLQINREHIYEYDLHLRAANREIAFTDVEHTGKRGRLTSYLGMGEIRQIDESVAPIRIQSGDRILLMTDGVFKTLDEDELTAILREYPDSDEALQEIERKIQEKNLSKQDNYTAVLMDLV